MFSNVRAILLDRDGVLNADSDAFIKTPDEWIPLEGAIEGIVALSRLQVHIAICSNQSGIGRRKLSCANLAAIHRKLFGLVTSSGGRIDVIRYCPHGPGDGCSCRKPGTGMIEDLCRLFDLEAKDVLMVGDAARDLQSALRAGAGAVLVRTGHGVTTETRAEFSGLPVFDDLRAFAAAFRTS